MKTALNSYAKRQALLAGIAYVIIFFTAIFANFYVLEGLFGRADHHGLTAAIRTQVNMFQYGNAAFFITMILDVVLAWQLYIITKDVDKELSAFSGLLRLIYAAVLGIALYHLSQMLFLATTTLNIETDTLDWLIFNHKLAFNKVWVTGLVLFGIHLMIYGFLFIKGTGFSSWIGYGLLLAGSGYIADGVGQLILANYEAYAYILDTWVLIGGVTGEMAFMVYLFVLAFRKEVSVSVIE